jgi:hypothetical protein
MLDKSVDRIGEWNPQLFRELKSKLSGNASIAAVAISIFIQVIGFGFFSATSNSFNNGITAGFHLLNWLIPIALMLGGVYTIVADLNQEEQRGTLNFIRLTPQSARSIFIGKMLGAPSLIYIGVLLTVPLHLFVSMCAGTSPIHMLAWYGTIGVTTYLCLSLAILYTIYSHKYAILLTLLFSLPVNTFLSLYNSYSSLIIMKQEAIDSNSTDIFSWLFIPIDRHIMLLDSLIICTFLLISYWIWVTLDRKYINPTSTPFKKSDSYWMNAQFQLWLLGFALPIVTRIDADRASDKFYVLATFYSISAIWVYCLIPLILPNKWSMQDWSRYRRDRVTHEHRQWWQQDIVRDLIWHDRSPIGLAMLINLLISATLWGVCFGVFLPDLQWLAKTICGVIIVSILTLIHTVVVNLIFLRARSKNAVAIPLIVLMSALPLCLGFMAVITSDYRMLGTGLFLFSPFSWMGVTQLSIPNIGMIIMGQIGILAGVTKLLQRRLQKLGRSDTQAIDRQQSSLAGTNP